MLALERDIVLVDFSQLNNESLRVEVDGLAVFALEGVFWFYIFGCIYYWIHN